MIINIDGLLARAKKFFSFTSVDDTNHLLDLKTRLQLVIYKRKPKGERSNGGSQASARMIAKARARLAHHSARCQFGGEIMPDGRHKYYRVNGMWLERTSTVA